MTMTSKRIAIYCRTATKNSDSITSQERALKHHINKNGGQLIGTYHDNGQSGTSINRPALSAMLSDLKKKKVHVVLVHSLDRFARGYNAFNSVFIKLTAAGVKLATPSAVYETDDLGMMITTAMNNAHSRHLSESIKRGIAMKKTKDFIKK